MSSQVYSTFIVAKNTYLEAIRSKILHSVVLFGIVLVGLATLFGSVSIGDMAMVIKSFGYTIISISGVVCIVITGVSLFQKEISQKTIYNLLSKPISRSSFIYGKFFGLWLTGIVLSSLMMVLLIFQLLYMEQSFDILAFEALFYMFLELGIIAAVTILFSSVSVTPVLPGLFTLATYISGKSIYYLKYFSSVDGQHGQVVLKFGSNKFIKIFIDFLYQVLPDLHLLTPYDKLLYGNSVLRVFGLYAFIYSMLYIVVLLLISSFFFKRRDF